MRISALACAATERASALSPRPNAFGANWLAPVAALFWLLCCGGCKFIAGITLAFAADEVVAECELAAEWDDEMDDIVGDAVWSEPCAAWCAFLSPDFFAGAPAATAPGEADSRTPVPTFCLLGTCTE